MAIQTYGFTPSSASVGSGVRVQLHGANPRRVSILVGANVSVIYRIAYGPGSGLNNCWISAQTNVPTTLTYRDCGPVIQLPIYIEHNQGVAVIFTVTEVYRIGDCQPCV